MKKRTDTTSLRISAELRSLPQSANAQTLNALLREYVATKVSVLLMMVKARERPGVSVCGVQVPQFVSAIKCLRDMSLFPT